MDFIGCFYRGVLALILAYGLFFNGALAHPIEEFPGALAVDCHRVIQSLTQDSHIEEERPAVPLERYSPEAEARYPYSSNSYYFRSHLGTVDYASYHQLAARAARSAHSNDAVVMTPDGAHLKYYEKENVILMVKNRQLIFATRLEEEKYHLSHVTDPRSTSKLFLRLTGLESGPLGLQTRLWSGQAITGVAGFYPDLLNLKFEKHQHDFRPPISDVKEYERRAMKFVLDSNVFQLLLVRKRELAGPFEYERIIKFDLRSHELAVVVHDRPSGESRILTYYSGSNLSKLLNKAFISDEELNEHP